MQDVVAVEQRERLAFARRGAAHTVGIELLATGGLLCTFHYLSPSFIAGPSLLSFLSVGSSIRERTPLWCQTS